MNFIKILIPFDKLLSDESMKNLAIASIMLGAKVESTENDITTYTNIKNDTTTYNMLTLDVIAYIVSLGGNALNYQTFIKVNLQDDVPSTIRDYYKLDENGNQINLKWDEWINVNNPAININNEYYMSSYAHYAGYNILDSYDNCLTGKEITSLRMNGYEVINKDEFINLQNITNE